MAKGDDDDEIRDLREVVADLKDLKEAISFVRDSQGTWQVPPPQLPARDVDWNFTTFEKYISQRFIDLSMNLRERFEAQQTGLAAALSAAEKAVNAALIAAEKAVDKAERAQELRNQVSNEFRSSLSDLSNQMWKATEGQAAVDALRREYLTGHKTLEERANKLETGAANIQGRIWAVSALFTIAALAIELGSRFIGH
jgi:hypothetical protein